MIQNNMEAITPYLKDSWNVLDAFVVFASIADMVLGFAGINMTQI